ncbi:MAG: GTP 3',8-cyclase MoaA [Deltaproteobacteria bacterium]|nr:GTP 3',8-cyclase MoaA [Deltaproteobacteria bacterium]
MLVDGFQRQIDYLRLSVTDLCNLRCQYCMPFEGVPRMGKENILTFEEITRLVQILVPLGIRRVRLTGGEPLVRRDVPSLVKRLKEIPGLQEVLMTTNAILLKPVAQELKNAGLEKINIHLDTLSPEKFRKITRWGEFQNVLDGIEEAKKAGLKPIKLNAVIQKGINDDEVEGLLLFAAEKGLVLRLIELMPIGPAHEMMGKRFIPIESLRSRLEEKYSLLPARLEIGSGPAVYYKVRELGTLIGFISPVSQPFCKSCNRIRIGSDGRFQDCLAYDGSFSLRDLLRNPNYSDKMVAEEIVHLLQGKRESHKNFIQDETIQTPCMYGIGG